MKKKIQLLKLDEILALFICLWIVYPLSYKTIQQLIIMILGIVWMAVSYSRRKCVFRRCISHRIFLASCLYPVIVLVLSIRSDVDFEKKCILEPVIILIFLYYNYTKEKNTAFFLANSVICYLLIIAVFTSVRLFYEPNISRALASAAHESALSFLTGGYESVYCIMLLMIVLLGIMLNNKKWNIFGVLLIFLVFIIKAQYVMAVLLMMAGMTLMAVSYTERTWFLFIMMTIWAFVFVLTGIIDIPELLYSIGDMLPESFFKTRAYALSGFISNLMNGIASSQSVSGTISRYDLYKQSVDAFRNHLLLGVGNVNINLVGNHATFLDELARYGITAGGLYIITRIYMLRKVRSLLPTAEKKQYTVISFIYVLMSCFNTTKRTDFILIMLLVVPYLYMEYEKLGKKKCIEY